nr:hypothetical protein Iba_chr01eCG0840 [Ipomoea batatas]
MRRPIGEAVPATSQLQTKDLSVLSASGYGLDLGLVKLKSGACALARKAGRFRFLVPIEVRVPLSVLFSPAVIMLGMWVQANEWIVDGSSVSMCISLPN